MGTAYFAGGTLGWALTLFGSSPPLVYTGLGLALRTFAVFCLSLGSMGLGVGTWRIFRPERRWMVWAFSVLGAVLVAEFVRNALLERTPFVRADQLWYWPGALGRSLPFWWSTYESLRYHGLLRRRLRIGLSTPVLANKMLLWSVSGVVGSVMCFLAVAGTVFDFDYRYGAAMAATYGALGVVSATCIGLAFFPPERYLKFVARASAAAG
jgi:hypothetical protein